MQTNELPLSLLIRVVLLTGDTKNAQRYVAIYGTSGMDEKTFFDGLSRNDVRQALMDYYPILAPYCTLKSDSPTVTSGLFSEKTSRKALVNGVLENIRAKYEILDLLLQLQEKYHAVENPEHENELNCLIVKVKNATQFMDDPKKFLLEEIQFAILAGKGNSRLYAALDELVSTMKKGEGISRERLEKIVAHLTVNKSAQTQQMHL